MNPCFYILYAKFWPYHLNVAAEIETHQTRQRFSNLLLSGFGDPVWIVSSVSCSYLTRAAPGVVFCCCSTSASGFDVLCVQRWYSAYIGCNEWLFELLLPFYHLYPVCPFSSDINKAFSSTRLPLTGYFLFFGPFSVNPRDGCVPVDQQFLKYSDQPVWHQQPFHVQNHLNPLSSPFWCSVWSSASRLHHI